MSRLASVSAWLALPLLAADPAPAEEETAGWLGVILPAHSVDVIAEVQGTVARVPIGLGSIVAAGDTLAVLHAPSIDAELWVAEARVLAAEAEVAARGARVDELRRVLAKRTEASRLFTQDEIEVRRSELRIAEADRSLAEAGAEEARVRRTEIGRRVAGVIVRAPFPGRIAWVHIVPGDQVAENQRVLRVVDTERVRVRFAVPEQELLPPEREDTLRVVYEGAEVAAVVTARAPLLETEAGCLVFEAEPLVVRGGRAAAGPAFPIPAGAVVRVSRSAPAASPGDREP